MLLYIEFLCVLLIMISSVQFRSTYCMETPAEYSHPENSASDHSAKAKAAISSP